MATMGLSELPAALRTVLEQGEAVDVTDQGTIVARLVPVPSAQVELDVDLYRRVQARVVDLDHLPAERPLTGEERAQLETDLAAFDELAKQIGAAWQDDQSVVEAIREQRRDL